MLLLKFPRWDLQKFKQVSTLLGSEMKSVGEVMSIGRSFEEALQKSIRMLDIGMNGLVLNDLQVMISKEQIEKPNDKRLLYIAAAVEGGMTIDEFMNYQKLINGSYIN